MGSSGSKPDVEVTEDETAFFAQRGAPVQFSESLINHLSATSLPSTDGNVSSSRQQTLDSHIQTRIQSELARLREQEQSVREEIERALEKENLDREKGASTTDQDGKAVSHSASLLKDLEELEKRTLGLREESKKQLDSGAWKSLEANRQTLLQCFRENKETPLNCQEAVAKFKSAVVGVEKAFVANIQ